MACYLQGCNRCRTSEIRIGDVDKITPSAPKGGGLSLLLTTSVQGYCNNMYIKWKPTLFSNNFEKLSAIPENIIC